MVALCLADKFRSRRFLLRISLVLLTLVLFSYGVSYLLLSNAENEPLFYGHYRSDHSHYTGVPRNVSDPIILWWTPFTKRAGHTRTCGQERCFFTEDRIFFNHTNLQVLGWFNHTSTFRRNSDLPLTLQYLNYITDLTSKEFFVDTTSKTRARTSQSLIAYVQSDCNTPIERDSFVSELMKYVSIDSFGKCIHNKDLPKELVNAMDAMDNKAFWRLLANYKFHLAIENYVCEDYITEKLWRPLIVGSVPIYFGSPSVVDWLPNYANSAILVANYSGPEKLAEAIKQIDGNDMMYESFLSHKLHGRVTNKALLSAMKNRRWGVNDPQRPSFVEEFECLICSRIWKRLKNPGTASFIANASHYSCDMPHAMLTRQTATLWKDLYRQAKTEAEVFEDLLLANVAFGGKDVQNKVLSLLQARASHSMN
ncbi:alpha-(1,3)-fucosyltransferase 10 isoform X2 [Rhipicephalus microplus]|uniref:alpha-(1,3)-fucosyltransferase 10 isoform X2 n=1 Tax=Rhipicephalus microplus TaxID=6941 RepID=UPI003F6AC30F